MKRIILTYLSHTSARASYIPQAEQEQEQGIVRTVDSIENQRFTPNRSAMRQWRRSTETRIGGVD
jgi:hypothetical protein